MVYEQSGSIPGALQEANEMGNKINKLLSDFNNMNNYTRKYPIILLPARRESPPSRNRKVLPAEYFGCLGRTEQYCREFERGGKEIQV